MLGLKERRFCPSAAVCNPWQGVARELWAVGIIRRGVSNAAGRRGTRREHARYQRQWNVYRSRGSPLDRRGLHGALESQAAVKGRLLRETNRTGARDGRFRGTCRIRKPETLPGSSFLALRDRRLTAIYTRAGRCLDGVQPGEE